MTVVEALIRVRRMRRRLEGVRLLRAGSRGLLAGSVLALPLLFVGPWAWALPILGAGLGVAFGGRAVRESDAALFLDARARTGERYVTVHSHPRHADAASWAQPLDGALPTLRWPREAAAAPVALFLLFAVGLVPTGGEQPIVIAAVADEASGAASEERTSPVEAADELATTQPLDESARKRVERAIEQAFARPEERAAARAELDKAAGGAQEARDRLADALREGAGALGGESDASRSETGTNRTRLDDARVASPYPDQSEYLRAFQVELARLQNEGESK
ncbi:MAG: hypothetical protein AAGD14_11750 [Planctomycetota bacterium]